MSKLPVALLLMAVCVFVHAAGLTSALRWMRRRPAAAWSQSTRRMVGVLAAVAAWAILLHVVEIGVWALVYLGAHVMPDLASALYFSAVTYTTTGYGDLVLPPGWRLMGAVEALTGILMCGLSTGLFFAVFAKIVAAPEPASTG